MTCHSVWFHGSSKNTRRSSHARGFTLLEMLFAVVIVVVLTAIAIPLMTNVLAVYRMRSAVSSVTGLIQSARYQAISSGYAYQVVLTKSTSTYQVQSDPTWPTATTFTNYCVPPATSCPVPLSNSGIVAVLGTDTTLQFRPSGMVTAIVGSTTLTLTYGGKVETITVSSYGNIKVTP
jgi:prepilin-type N-terminal cleavage/methylation domain-containing protein